MQLYLFGKFSFFDPDHRSSMNQLSASPKLQELFAYLSVHPERPLMREELAKEIWHEHPARRAFEYTSKALHKLETLCGGANLDRLSHPGGVQWNRNVDLWVDVQEFETTFQETSAGFRESIERLSIAKLLAAADLCRGPFLEGCYSPWCSDVRNLLEQEYLQLLEMSMDACEAQRDYDTGIACGLRAIAVEHSRESTHRRLMRLFYLVGDRTSALRQYRGCAEALAEDLGIQPGEQTVRLYRQIQASGQLPLAPLGLLPVSLHKTLRDLHNLDQTVSHLQEIPFVSMAGTHPSSQVR